MSFLEADNRRCFMKKILQYSQKSCRPATLVKRDSNTHIGEHLLTAASDFLKQLQSTSEQLLLY